MHPLRAYLLRFVPELTAADWQALAEALRPRHLARGAHFVQAGERRPELALLLSGACRLYYPPLATILCTTRPWAWRWG